MDVYKLSGKQSNQVTRKTAHGCGQQFLSIGQTMTNQLKNTIRNILLVASGNLKCPCPYANGQQLDKQKNKAAEKLNKQYETHPATVKTNLYWPTCSLSPRATRVWVETAPPPPLHNVLWQTFGYTPVISPHGTMMKEILKMPPTPPSQMVGGWKDWYFGTLSALTRLEREAVATYHGMIIRLAQKHAAPIFDEYEKGILTGKPGPLSTKAITSHIQALFPDNTQEALSIYGKKVHAGVEQFLPSGFLRITACLINEETRRNAA